jgi:DNA-binding CsgD family transcriptional regulator
MIKALKEELTKKETLALLELSYNSLRCDREDVFKKLVLELKEFMLFENAAFARGNVVEFLDDNNADIVVDCLDISYPPGYTDYYFSQDLAKTDSVLLELMATLSPVSWHEVDKKCNFSYPAYNEACDLNMKDGWSHGVLDPINYDLTALFLGSPYKDGSARNAQILEYVVPFYAQAYHLVLKKKAKPKTKLTQREREVLNWLKEGKSSWEISQILRCSERTVNFHFNNIKAKLGVVNRAQAVAVGLQYGIIRF